MVTSAVQGPHAPQRARLYRTRRSACAEGFAARAAEHDRTASFPFENFRELAEAGLLSLTVPAALGGAGAGAEYAANVLGIIGNA